MSGTEYFQEEGRYRRLRVIDEGGMGVVYLAHDSVLDRKVALKVLAPRYAADREFAVRLAHEARAMAAIESHPHIVQIFDVIMDRHELCLVLEFVDGINFRDLMPTAGFTEELAFKLLKEVSRALAYLHDRKTIIVHRDIKPANILLRKLDQEIKLIDFGIARLASRERLTEAGKAVGTGYYMAPEVLAGQDATPASDIWSLGIVMREAVRHLRDRNPDLPFGALDSIILDMTEEDPAMRPAARDLARGDFAQDAHQPDGYQTADAPTVPHPASAGEPEPPVVPVTALIEPESPQTEPEQAEPLAEEAPVSQRPEPADPDESTHDPYVPAARPPIAGKKWSLLAGTAVLVSILVWSISPVGPLRQGPGPQAAPSGTVSLSTTPTSEVLSASPLPSATGTLSPAMAGPWTVDELDVKLEQDLFKIAVAIIPGRNPMMLTAAKTESVPLDPDAEYVVNNQAESPGGKQVIAVLRLAANKGGVDFTPHATTCTEMAKAGPNEVIPGTYMVVPLTDVSSTFKGTPVTVSGRAYGIVRADCDHEEVGNPTIRATMKVGATGPAQNLNLKFRLPVRPDGTWDRAATPSLGMFMVSKEGHVVILES